MKNLFAGVAGCLLLGGCTSVPPMSLDAIHPQAVVVEGDPHIDWSVTNRFRLIDDAVKPEPGSKDGASIDDEARFYRDLALETVEYEKWYSRDNGHNIWLVEPHFDLIHDNPEYKRHFRNYQTRYSPLTASYRCRLTGAQRASDRACSDDPSAPDWVADQTRTVVVSVAKYGDVPCIWTVDGVATIDRCDGHRISVRLGQAVTVTGRLAGDPQASTLTTDPIVVRDVKIVALGDSFSAGEGIPHSQWRWLFTGDRPAIWLDPRCHRSLLSAPSLAAAYIARNNPHLSVTLLHYGCSGGSVADGVLTPWGNLESDADVKLKAKQFKPLPAWQGQETAKLGGSDTAPDVGLSQIEQARLDLSENGGPPAVPDAVVVSAGGNDIGFAGIIAGLIGPILTPTDLKPDSPADKNVVEPFDAAMWSNISAQQPCGYRQGIECMAHQVTPRVGGAGLNGDVRYLDRQYDALRTGLNGLVPDRQHRVFITEYPYFVFREPKLGESGIETVDGKTAVGCVDRLLDGQPDMVPAFLAVTPWFGMKKGSADEALKGFETPLNDAIERAAQRGDGEHWNVVKSHLPDTVQNGYCSSRRYFNTMIDAYWYQGRKYGPDRDLGNVQILNGEGLGLPAGERLVWDDHGPTPCFRRWRYANDTLPPADLGCVTENELLHKKLHQNLPPRVKPGFISWLMRDALTTGPVHPNLYGHCTYAAAIVSSIVSQNPSNISFDPQFVANVTKSDGLHTKDICTPKAWGWEAADKALN